MLSCYNRVKSCCAGWAGFIITLLHYPLFAYFPHTQDSQQSIQHNFSLPHVRLLLHYFP